MADISLFERISKIFDVVFSSSFFVALLIIIILTIILLVINKRSNRLFPKIIAGLGYFLIALYIITRYGSYFFQVNDSFVDKVFSAMYFPNLITYICMLGITIFALIKGFVNRKYSNIIKIGSIICFSMIWFLFVLILDVIKTNKIDIYEVKSIYSNETLMVILQASMYLFFIWMGILFINYIVNKINDTFELKSNSNKRKNVDILPSDEKFEDVKEFSDYEFIHAFVDKRKSERNEEYQKIIKHKNTKL